jgi:steroid delta-isomerase-like uncharacterized protein
METNVSLARRWFEDVWNRRRIESVQEMIGHGGVTHSESGDFTDPEQFLEHVYKPTLAAFPDVHVHIEETVADNDRVVVRWRAEATHSGAGLGIPPTGRRISFRGMTLIRFQNGKMIEGYDAWNQAGLLHVLQSGQSLGSVKLL